MGVSILATTQRFREYTRAPCEAPVRLQFNSFEDYEEARLANISLGGMFVAYRDPKPVGCLLRFELHLDEAAAPILGLGEVVWIRVRGQGPNRPAGMGIEFRAVKDEDFEGSGGASSGGSGC